MKREDIAALFHPSPEGGREKLIAMVDDAGSVESDGDYLFLLCHTHQHDAGSNVWVRGNIDPAVLEMLCASIQQETTDFAHSYGMGEREVADMLVEFYGCQADVPVHAGNDYYAIDLFLAWETWCPFDLTSLEAFRRDGLVSRLREIVPEEYVD